MALDDLAVEQFLSESHPAYRETYEQMPEAVRKRVIESLEYGGQAAVRRIISSYYLESRKAQRGQEVGQSRRTVKAQSQSVHGEIIEVEAGAITVPELEEKLLQVAHGPDAKLTDPVPVSFPPDHLCPASGNQQEIVAALNRLLAAYVQQLHGETLPEDQVPTLSKLKEFAFLEAEPPSPGPDELLCSLVLRHPYGPYRRLGFDGADDSRMVGATYPSQAVSPQASWCASGSAESL